jgi:hypothetical protein
MGKLFVLPVIRPEDYTAFRRDIGHHIADTYEEWAKLVAGEVAQARQDGKTVIERVIDNDDFSDIVGGLGKLLMPQFYCNSPRTPPLEKRENKLPTLALRLTQEKLRCCLRNARAHLAPTKLA